jgi:hypothetical protein
VTAFEQMRNMLPGLSELPPISWNRIAGEMSANIRLGLAAGECVREPQEPAGESPLYWGARTAIAMASVAVLLVTALVIQRPTPPIMSAAVPVAQTTKDGIQTRSGDSGFALMHTNARDVSYTVGAQGTMGASYVDPSTGYVTMTKVYAE